LSFLKERRLELKNTNQISAKNKQFFFGNKPIEKILQLNFACRNQMFDFNWITILVVSDAILNLFEKVIFWRKKGTKSLFTKNDRIKKKTFFDFFCWFCIFETYELLKNLKVIVFRRYPSLKFGLPKFFVSTWCNS
jgi:hypothetical protein